MLRKIVKRVPDEVLQQDLERYRQRALEMGAADARIITTDTVIVDERVRAKCIHPLCAAYGTNINCPPHAPDLDLIRKVVSRFRHALFCKLEVPAAELAGPEAEREKKDLTYNRIISEIVAKIEAEVFRDGYYLATGFAYGSCKGLFCPNIECNALTRGQPCRFPLKARVSMEGAGMDVYAMATKAGWDIYPLGRAAPPPDVPFGALFGLVLIY